MTVRVRQVKVGPMENFAYVLVDEATRAAAVVDPGFSHARLLEAAAGLDGHVRFVLLTHGHHDHVAEAAATRDATGAEVVAHPHNPVTPDVPVKDGDVVALGETDVRVVATPGHSPDAVCFVVAGHVLTGDTLFVGECGRADLPGSDPRALRRSLLVTLKQLANEDPDLVVLPGHDYGKTPTSTLGREFETNYTLKERSEEEFLAFVLNP